MYMCMYCTCVMSGKVALQYTYCTCRLLLVAIPSCFHFNLAVEMCEITLVTAKMRGNDEVEEGGS